MHYIHYIKPEDQKGMYKYLWLFYHDYVQSSGFFLSLISPFTSQGKKNSKNCNAEDHIQKQAVLPAFLFVPNSVVKYTLTHLNVTDVLF